MQDECQSAVPSDREKMLEAQLERSLGEVQQYKYLVSAVISQRDEAINKLADAIARIAMLEATINNSYQ